MLCLNSVLCLSNNWGKNNLLFFRKYCWLKNGQGYTIFPFQKSTEQFMIKKESKSVTCLKMRATKKLQPSFISPFAMFNIKNTPLQVILYLWLLVWLKKSWHLHLFLRCFFRLTPRVVLAIVSPLLNCINFMSCLTEYYTK